MQSHRRCQLKRKEEEFFERLIDRNDILKMIIDWCMAIVYYL